MPDYTTKAHRIELGEAIRARRDKQGITQQELALKTDCGQSNIYRIETGRVSVGIDVLVRIARALEITVGELVSF